MWASLVFSNKYSLLISCVWTKRILLTFWEYWWRKPDWCSCTITKVTGLRSVRYLLIKLALRLKLTVKALSWILLVKKRSRVYWKSITVFRWWQMLLTSLQQLSLNKEVLKSQPAKIPVLNSQRVCLFWTKEGVLFFLWRLSILYSFKLTRTTISW